MKRSGVGKQELELGKEYPQPDEDQTVQALVAMLRGRMVERDTEGKTLRATHPKDHGCVKAELVVEPDLPDELRVGVFSEARTYPAWVRFSNGFSTVRPDDQTPDSRGIAIKLMGVEGEKILENEKDAKTQDFLFIGRSVPAVGKPEEFVGLLGSVNSRLKSLWFFFNPFDSHIRNFIKVLSEPRVPASPLEMRYWSTTPYRFGTKAVKYSIKPRPVGTTKVPKKPSDDFLLEAVERHLSEKEANFDFMIQFQKDPHSMPIEDAFVDWDEEESPFLKVASLRIPSQSLESEAQKEFCEHLAFNIWHSLPEHKPLGGVNRVRKEIYLALSEFRRKRNGVEVQEPTGDEVF